jgi:hypothetical protein
MAKPPVKRPPNWNTRPQFHARHPRPHRRQVVGVSNPRARRSAHAALQRAGAGWTASSAHVDGDAARSGARRLVVRTVCTRCAAREYALPTRRDARQLVRALVEWSGAHLLEVDASHGVRCAPRKGTPDTRRARFAAVRRNAIIATGVLRYAPELRSRAWAPEIPRDRSQYCRYSRQCRGSSRSDPGRLSCLRVGA